MWVMFKKVSLLRRERFKLEALGVPDADLAEVVQIAAHLELCDGSLVQLEMPTEHGGELADTHRMAERHRVLVGHGGGKRPQRPHVLSLKRLCHVVDRSTETADFVARFDVRTGREVPGGHLLCGQHEAVDGASYGARDVEADREHCQHCDAEEQRHLPAGGFLRLD